MVFSVKDIRQHDCVQKAYAGAVIGTVCGFIFGGMDAANASGLTNDLSSSALRQKFRSPTIMRFFFRHHLGVTGMFGLMYTTYQSAKCGIETYGGPDVEDVPKYLGASACALVPFLPSRIMRRNLPYALILIALDVYNGGLK